MLLWNLALHPVLCRVMDRHPEVLAICFSGQHPWGEGGHHYSSRPAA
jgi:hypothetical protein